MAAYPSVPMLTVVEPRASLKIDAAVSGAVRGVDLSAEDIFDIEVTHTLLTAAERDTVINFYNANKALVVALTAGDGNTYDVLFTARPGVSVVTPIRFTVTAKMVGNKQ